MLSQREYWRAVWSGAARDAKAEAVILHTAATAILALSGKVETRFEDCLEKASDLWAKRNPRRTGKTEHRTAGLGRIAPVMALVSAFALAALPDLASAQQKGDRPNGLGAFEGTNQVSETHGHRQLTCGVSNMQKLCVIGQPLTLEGTAQEASIELIPVDTTRAQAVITLPFTIDIASGVKLAVDQGAPVASLSIQGCSEYGCHAAAIVDRDLLQTLGMGTELHLVATGLEDKREVAFSADLEGLAAAGDRALMLSK